MSLSHVRFSSDGSGTYPRLGAKDVDFISILKHFVVHALHERPYPILSSNLSCRGVVFPHLASEAPSLPRPLGLAVDQRTWHPSLAVYSGRVLHSIG